LNVRKLLLLAKQTQVHAEKTRGAGLEVTQTLREETWNAASNFCWQSVQDPCGVVFENCGCSWRSDLKICLFSEIFPIFVA